MFGFFHIKYTIWSQFVFYLTWIWNEIYKEERPKNFFFWFFGEIVFLLCCSLFSMRPCFRRVLYWRVHGDSGGWLLQPLSPWTRQFKTLRKQGRIEKSEQQRRKTISPKNQKKNIVWTLFFRDLISYSSKVENKLRSNGIFNMKKAEHG